MRSLGQSGLVLLFILSILLFGYMYFSTTKEPYSPNSKNEYAKHKYKCAYPCGYHRYQSNTCDPTQDQLPITLPDPNAGVPPPQLDTEGIYFALKKTPSTIGTDKDKDTEKELDFLQALEYPLETLESDNENGYEVSASSTAPNSSVTNAFHYDPMMSWRSAVNTYDSEGVYIGTISTRVNDEVVKGEWIEIVLPIGTSIRPTETKIAGAYYGVNTAPRKFVIAGSTDGEKWTLLLDNRTTEIEDWTDARKSKAIPFPSNLKEFYRYFRLIITVVGNPTSSNKNQVQIASWKIIGNPQVGSQTVPPVQRGMDLWKTQQISNSACITTDSKMKKNRPLTDQELADSTYSYGLADYKSGRDGVFVKQGCRGRFQIQPTKEDVYCSSWDQEPEYCRARGEVFQVTSNDGFTKSSAEEVCASYGAEEATVKQLRTALQQKGMWCQGGWTKDSAINVYNPYLTDTTDKAGQSCGTSAAKIFYDYLGGGIDVAPAPASGKAPVNCYGVRPSQARANHRLIDFSKDKVSMYTPPASEVFLVDRNGYSLTRDQAHQVCQEYGAELASYADVQDAYNKGADWCRSGWVSDPDKKAAWPIQVERQWCAKGINDWIYKDAAGNELATATCKGVKPKESLKPTDLIFPWRGLQGDSGLPYVYNSP